MLVDKRCEELIPHAQIQRESTGDVKIILYKISCLPVGNYHGRPRLIHESSCGRREPLKETGESVRTASGVCDGSARTSSVHGKSIHRIVRNKVGASFDRMPTQ